MADEVFVSSTLNVAVDDSYYVNREDDEMGPVLKHPRLARFWAMTPFEGRRILQLVHMLAAINPAAAADVAIIGSGIGDIARALIIRPWSRLDLYEINPVPVQFFQSEYPGAAARVSNIVVGDYLSTLSGLYSFLIYDIDYSIPPADLPFLRSHKRPAGVILAGRRWAVVP